MLEPRHLDPVRGELERIKPMKAAFYPQFVRRLSGPHLERAASRAEIVEQLRDDIRRFLAVHECSRGVAIWCGSTEVHVGLSAVHASVEAFERGLHRSDGSISNSQLYAWACLQERVP